MTPTGVKKLDENEGGCIDNGLKLIPLMNPEKIGINLKPKSARKSREKVVKPVIESLVGRPNPENDFLSKGTGSQENTKRRKKKLKNEMDLRKMRPISSYFEKKSQILQEKIEGESSP